ncbi:hypothetical protein CDAR_376631 [Caerostris darwini]|uniref:Uncharacterized protein n=1 Tax=Caerostris darwini TaxID=1538125 RepID=A0AAV4R7C2_9ARAC|nr:hypothetical protein CDAR_376631 [Caerostris darwini]
MRPIITLGREITPNVKNLKTEYTSSNIFEGKSHNQDFSTVGYNNTPTAKSGPAYPAEQATFAPSYESKSGQINFKLIHPIITLGREITPNVKNLKTEYTSSNIFEGKSHNQDFSTVGYNNTPTAKSGPAYPAEQATFAPSYER